MALRWGAKFETHTVVRYGMHPVSREDVVLANRALVLTAEALGYAGVGEYNEGCVENPAEVERRLRELRPEDYV